MTPTEQGPYRAPAPPSEAPSAAPAAPSLGAVVRTFEPTFDPMRLLPWGWLALISLAAFGANVPWLVSLGCALLAVIPATALWAAMRLLRYRAQRVVLHEDGLVIGEGRRRREVHFDDVDLLYLGFDFPILWIVPRGNRIRLVLHDGTRIEVKRLEELVKLFETLRRRLSLSQLPSAREALARGESLRFGAIVLDEEGVAFGAERRTWKELDEVRYDLEHIRFFAGGRVWRQAGVFEVPHCALLAALLAARLPLRTELPFWAEPA